MAAIIPNLAPATGDRASGAQVIDGSLKFDDNIGTHLKKTQGSDGDRRRWTWSGWVKQNTLSTSAQVFVGGPGDADRTIIRLTSSNKLEVEEYSSGAYQFQYATEQLFRDVSGFMHICVNYDSTNSIAVDRVRVYVNGNQITNFSTYNDADQGFESRINSAATHFIGRHAPSSTQYLDANLSQVYLIDGQALTPDNFGFNDPLTNTWRPKKFNKDPYTANDGTTWSSGSITGTSGGSAVTISTPGGAFDGDTSTSASFTHVANNDSILTWNPQKTIHGKRFRIYVYQPQGTSGANMYLKTNNGAYVSDSNWAAVSANSTGWSDYLTIPDGGLESISIKLSYGGASTQEIHAIEVDDVILIDDVVQRKSLRNPNDGTTWSDSASNTNLIYIGNIGQVFNGANLPWTSSNYSSFNVGTLTLFSSQNIEVKSSIRIFGNWMSNDKIEINGTEYACDADGSQKWISPTGVTYPLTLNSLAIDTTPGNVQNSLSAVEIDGYVLIDGATDNSFYLPMDGSAPIGHDKFNPKPINNGTVWSSSASVDSGSSDMVNAFDGDTSTSTSVGLPSGGATVTFTPSSAITVSRSLRVYMAIDRGQSISVNGSQTNASVSAGWNDTGFTGSLTSLVIGPANSGSSSNISAIEVDGAILVDGIYGNGFKPINFGGSASLEKATGALPILNTTQGGTQAGVGVRPDGRSYSDNTTASGGFNSSYPKTNLFDGRSPADSNRAEADSNDDAIDITFSPAINVGSTISLWSGKSSTRYQINNSGSYTTYSDAVGSYKDISHSGALTNLKILHGSAGQAAGISAIKIDGTQLVDHNGIVLALPLIGNKEDVVASINSTQTNVTVTNNGSVPFQTTQSNFYGGSAFFEDSSSDNLTFTNFGSRFEFTGDYTIEAWIYPTDSGAADGSIFVEQSGSNYFAFNFDPGTQFNIYNNSSSASWTPSTNLPPANKWSHIALVRYGSAQTIYVNGNSIASNRVSGTHGYASPSMARIGGGGSGGLDSYIQDLRIYNGVAKYTSDFIPASTSPDILPDTPSGVSVKSKLTEITDGAVGFDGDGGQHLRVEDADMALGTGDFTVEAFIYNNVHRNYVNYIGTRESGQSDPAGWCIASDTNANLYWYSNGMYDTLVFAKMATNKWYHVACTRASGTHRWFIDGVLQGTNTTSRDYTDDLLTIGDNSYFTSTSNDEPLEGFVSNVRIIKGSIPTEYQTSSTTVGTQVFTPPTEPLTNVTNTKLLCCQSNKKAYIASVVPGTSLNDGTVWSSNGQDNLTTGSSWANVFNGRVPPDNSSYSDVAAREGSGNTSTITFSPAISGNIRVRVSSSASSGTTNGSVSLSDSSSVNADVYPNSATWKDFGSKSNITSLTINAGSNGGCRLSAIEVDGFVLIDGHSGETVNVNGDSAATNFNPFNTDINIVRGQETGYATLNPLHRNPNGNTTSNGNLTQTTSAGNGHYRANFAIGASSGKFYFEYEPTGGAVSGMVGLCEQTHAGSNNLNGAKAYSYYGVTGYKQGSPSAVDSAYGATYTFGDVVGVAFDSDNNTLEFFKNGISQGVAFTSFPNYPYYPAFSAGSSSNTVTYNVNFGQKPFKFPPPDGFQPLSLSSIRPETVIARPDQYVGVATHTGTGSAQKISLPFQADLIWTKTRSHSVDHKLVDSVRGLTKVQEPNNSRVDSTVTNGVTGTTFNGFTIGDSGDYNTSGRTYVSWCWKAGGSKNTFNVDDVGYASAAAAGLTAGTITPDGASVGTKQGFSIVKFAGNETPGAKVPHGLSQTPDFTIVKQISGTEESWRVRHSSVNSTKTLYLNQSVGAISNTEYISGADSTTITLSTGLNGINGDNDYIMYAWHNVPGLQKFGTYSSNQNANGPFIELGFRPAMVWVKGIGSGSTSWRILDKERNPFNTTTTLYLRPNVSNGDLDDTRPIDIVSNGFKIRVAGGGDINLSSGAYDYVYCAWAEAPDLGLYGSQSNAR